MIALIGCCQLSMAGHCTPHLQGSHLLCKSSFLKKILYYLFIFGFAGSLLPQGLFLWFRRAEATLELWCVGFSLQWPLGVELGL